MIDLDKTFNLIVENKKTIREGGYNCIPHSLSDFSEYYPGVTQGSQLIISSNSGVGKTQLTKKLLIFDPIDRIIDTGEDLPYHILYFLFEESEEEFTLSLISHLLYKKYGIKKGVRELQSIKEELEDNVVQKIRNIKENELQVYSDKITLFDSVSNPYGIYKEVKNFAKQHGKLLLNGEEIEDNGRWNEYQSNKRMFVSVVIDHLSLIQKEKEDLSKRDAMARLSAYFLRRLISKKFYYYPVVVQQQENAREKAQFTSRGEVIEEKFEPSPDGLADCKDTFRDCLEMITLFSPSRYAIATYPRDGYDVTKFGDKIRFIKLHKNRYGGSQVAKALYFDGEVGEFIELPSIDDPDLELCYRSMEQFNDLRLYEEKLNSYD